MRESEKRHGDSEEHQAESLFIKPPPLRCVLNVHSAQSSPPFFSFESNLMLLEGQIKALPIWKQKTEDGRDT